MSSLSQQIPELAALENRQRLVRIPPEMDVPVTPRVQHLMDTAEFRRLARISQLGLVAHVYPAAHHSRFEHSLGVYQVALLYVQRLQHDPRFTKSISQHDAEVFLVAALLHDLGHWPFCHPIEDLNLPDVPEHELFANSFLLEGEIADALRDEWQIAPREVVSLLSEKPRDTKSRILCSMLSGPIDVDKMDYLCRDSLHAGVPYGRNFDRARLIGSLCLNRNGDGLALTEKGRTAAEMMVFSRYVMFSEVYWHHAVRSATAMLQRAFYLVYQDVDLDAMFRLTEDDMIRKLVDHAQGGPAEELLDGLFGDRRRLYKRLFQFSHFQDREMYDQLARKPFDWLAGCAENLARLVSQDLGRRVAPHEVLIDAPPPHREIEFHVDVYFPKEDCYRALGDVSPVVKTLAQQQFDDYVKRVRVFAHPSIIDDLRDATSTRALLQDAIAATNDSA
jgi:HD superfamily phosphohydrolase